MAYLLYGVLQVYRYLVGRCGKVRPLAQFERHARRTKELRGTKMGVVSRRGRSRELTRNVHIETFELDDASQGALKTSDISVVLTRRKVVSKDFCEALGGYAPLVLR